MRWRVLIPMAAGMLACRDTASPEARVGPLQVQPGAVAYPAGTTASLTLANLARIRLDYTPCFARLERRTASGQWIIVHEDQSPCPAVLEYLDPWASTEVAVPLPPDLQPAPHRVRFPSIGLRQNGEFVTATQVGGSFVILQEGVSGT